VKVKKHRRMGDLGAELAHKDRQIRYWVKRSEDWSAFTIGGEGRTWQKADSSWTGKEEVALRSWIRKGERETG